MRIGVTGGAGFIGGHVIETAIARGHSVIVFDHKGRIDREIAYDYRDYDFVTVMLGDTRDDVAMVELAAHVDGIIHLASVLGTQETVGNPRPAVMTNVLSGLNAFEAAVQYGLPCVNIAVGNAGMANPYSASKTCVETLGHMFVRDRGLRLNQVRAVNAYGPRQAMAAPYGSAKVRKITPAFIARALTGTAIEVYGDGNQVSDMVHVRDVARTLVNALEAAAGGIVVERVVEVGPVEHHNVNEVATLVNRTVLDMGLADRAGIKHLPMRPGETPGARITADTTTLPLIGIDPASLVPLEQGIRETVAWYAEHWLPGYLKEAA